MAEAETEEWVKTQGCRKILETLEGAIEQFQDNPRPAISDNLKVGFFTSDHATQTDSEILPLKTLIQSTEKLMQMITSLQVDFGFLKDLVQLKFEDQLKEESWKIITMLHDRILEMKRCYQETEDTIRKSFQQQLSDAIAVIKGMYKEFFEVEEEKAALQDAANMKIKVLMKKLKEKDEIIKNLRDELEQYEDARFSKIDSLAREPSSPRPTSEKELLECKMENERLLKLISVLEEEAQISMNENATLEDEIVCLKEISERDQRTIRKLMDSRDRLRYELDYERVALQDMKIKQGRDSSIFVRSAARQAKGVSESSHYLRPGSASFIISSKTKKKTGKKYTSGALMPPVPDDTERTSTDAVTAPAAAPPVPAIVSTTPISMIIADILSKSDKEKHVKFQLPQMRPEELVLKFQMMKDEEKRALESQVQELKILLEYEKKKTERLKKETDNTNKNWERKFLILRNSFHILKDEMFTRHTLFRQFAMIADTSFNYVKVKPLYVHATMNMSEPSSPTNAFQSPMVQMDPKFAEIPSDQVTFTHLPNVTFASRYNNLSLEGKGLNTNENNPQ
ncbi:uncharacterized protein C10orf67 homolog, mitochondrial [Acomys russatus]|uniref:uncharacterized protein C10orf67 homolog, mitochondrial n=1 Tax=Acomys russatus TaxID=60746 RepID=UPI0021E25AD3|nr:uncharacterized protein C10orf67 homolog, mitochondrial [Acomys russatus]